MTETILARIFERQLTLDRKIQNDVEQGRSLWEDMARSLEVIAANTAPEGPRGGRVAIAERAAPSGGSGFAGKVDQRVTFKPRSTKVVEGAPRQKKQTAASVGSVERKKRGGTRSGASLNVPASCLRRQFLRSSGRTRPVEVRSRPKPRNKWPWPGRNLWRSCKGRALPKVSYRISPGSGKVLKAENRLMRPQALLPAAPFLLP